MIDPKVTLTFMLEPEPIDGGYLCRAMELPGLLAHGDSRREALEVLAETVAAFEAVRDEQ